MSDKYDVIIGLEIHAELKTKSKMFCSCNNDAEGKEPNTVVCPICLGHPGTIPIANKQAIEWTILTGLALNCKVNKLSKFDRKNYFYPDLPKGYQISQYDLPFVYDGNMIVGEHDIKITRIHLEEDTGKSTHPKGKNHSLIDFNRGGTPLMEMVTEPVIPDAETAKKFCQQYQQILRYLEISDADMEKGQMRCEANVSVQEKGRWKYEGNCEIKTIGEYKLNPKVEVKNINSFKAVEKAIEYEIKRQISAIEDGDELVQETRGWNEKKNETVSQRLKETSADYRYFPEPDIPPLSISDEWINEIKKDLLELPFAKKERFIEQYFFTEDIADILVSDKKLAQYTEEVITELRAWIDSHGDDWERQQKKLAKSASNWLVGELFKHLKEDNLNITDIKITPENFAEFISLIYLGKINSSAGQTVLEEMYKNGGDPTQIMDNLGLEQIDDSEELESEIKQIISKNESQVAEYKAGKENVLQFFVGQAMAATKGKANPKTVIEILKKLLK
ncbi:MAG: Asp-tRNA(Asn)/Glu-tRNA(Gln) amidotransferase subunit GatB [Patescibacteria group bacterium]|jgi:aspartyl-tRNA(Asn)/glutamyl-tRNA(Gln) amidotransferase subunit B|nr:Asp-tRNA(Asn)/Glu-tRNA(Gln) amidotransferase subunit GatB [Patescibacteria group bacterium]